MRDILVACTKTFPNEATMRLTADLVNSSQSYLNPLKERELDLRGHKIPFLENLGSAANHDAIDLTDNDIPTLQNLPLMPRLRTLLLARNRITLVHPTVVTNIPNLFTLVLEGNRIAQLADLDVLAKFQRLTHLVLKGCPVTRVEHYRLWVLWRCPNVRFLDYTKVKVAEKEKAQELFGTADEPNPLAEKIMKVKSRQFDVPKDLDGGAGDATGQATDKVGRVQLTPVEKKHVRKLIANTKNLSEMARLEKILQDGKVPEGMVLD